MDTTLLPLDENGLYILLSEQDREHRRHWSLHLRGRELGGSTLRITRPSAAAPWRYEDAEARAAASPPPPSAALALKIAVIPPDMHGALRDRLARVPVDVAGTRRWGPLTCRAWLLRALSELDDEGGYIGIKPSATVEDVEAEAWGLARDYATAQQGGGRREADGRG